MVNSKSFLKLALFAFLLTGPENSIVMAQAPVISRITIRGTDIFDFETTPNLRRFPYTWINFLHIQTKEFVIRQELLFAVGDSLDPFLLRETERNLRSYSFIRSARAVAFPQRDGSVAVVVYVNDSWTTEPQLNLSGTNGVDNFEIGFKEKNLFGLGKQVAYFRNKKGDILQHEYSYFDPRLFHSRWQLTARLIDSNIGNTKSLSLIRPFYSTRTKFSGGAAYLRSTARIDQFQNNIKVSESRQTAETSEAFAGIKIGKSKTVVTHGGLRYSRQTKRFEETSNTTAGAAIPLPQERQTVFVDFDTTYNRFIEITQLEKMTRVEDVNLGPKFNLSPGYSPARLTGQKDESNISTSFEKMTRVKKVDYLRTEFKYSARKAFDESQNEILRIMLKNYWRKWPAQTLVAHTRLEWGNRLDADSQLILGNENGLRAYKRDALTGSRSLVLNLEDRFYWIDDLFDLFALGGVLFYDAGAVWTQGQNLVSNRVRSNIGAGLRIGLTHSSNESILRVDAGYRLQRANEDSPKFVITFGTDQAF